ncbi:MAG: hypothetical protein KIT22_13490 [Verrucomicrobiae bacterium]|nr:hypothetical protein [Verrucomicrobiae bacterium]
MEIALDVALQGSPEHPWLRDHPDWFYVRPDGTIKFGENPPKRYEDMYPLNFQCDAWREMWDEMLRIILFWVDHGVKTFRVDNPHTKPTVFWEWLIAEVQREHLEVIFLSEAFTRPKVMKALAKAGFAKSYTYFTWRNFKQELRRVRWGQDICRRHEHRQTSCPHSLPADGRQPATETLKSGGFLTFQASSETFHSHPASSSIRAPRRAHLSFWMGLKGLETPARGSALGAALGWECIGKGGTLKGCQRP